jgi:deoxycytidylate deaminase
MSMNRWRCCRRVATEAAALLSSTAPMTATDGNTSVCETQIAHLCIVLLVQ